MHISVVFAYRYVSHIHDMSGAHRGQKRTSDVLDLEVQLWIPYGSWKSNLVPLQELQVLLTAKLSLYP